MNMKVTELFLCSFRGANLIILTLYLTGPLCLKAQVAWAAGLHSSGDVGCLAFL